MNLSARQRRFLDRVVREVEPAGLNAPTTDQIAESFHVPVQAVKEIVRIGVVAGELLDVEGLLMTPRSLDQVAGALRAEFGRSVFSAAQARDLFGSNRRVIEKVLERLDADDVAVRTEGGRRLT